jgi:hypothetical protein
MAEFIRSWNEREKIPLSFGTPIDFYHALEGERASLPRHNGILDPCMWTFWYGLNGNEGLRRWRTPANQALFSGECLWSCATALGETFPEARYEHLWRELLGAYSHAQMWLFEADYAAQLERVKTVLSLGENLRDDAMQKITGRIKLKGDRSCAVLYNDLPWERTEVVPDWAELQDASARNLVVRDRRGNAVPFQPIDVNWYETGSPPHLSGGKPPDPGAHSGRGVESLLDEQSGAHYALPGAIIFNEIKDTGPYHYGPVVQTHRWSDAVLRKVVHGPLASAFTLEGALGPHHARLTGTIDPSARRLVFNVCINSAGGSGHFMATIGRPGRGRLFADTHFCVERRDVSTISYTGGERLRKNVFYGGHWVDYSDGQAGMTFVGSTSEKDYQLFPEENVLGHFLAYGYPAAPRRLGTVCDPGPRGSGPSVFRLPVHIPNWRLGGGERCATRAGGVAAHPRGLPESSTLAPAKDASGRRELFLHLS